MIRRLDHSQVPLMIEGGFKFFEEGKLPGKFNPKHFVEAWSELIKSGTGEVFGLFDWDGRILGALGAVYYPDMLTGDMVAIENFWFVFPEVRGEGIKLLKAFEDRARERHVKRICMIHLETLHPAVLKKIYERRGFRLVETGYIKEIIWQ